jgi:hypothetical protein
MSDKQLYVQMQYFEWLLQLERLYRLYPNQSGSQVSRSGALKQLEREFGTHISSLQNVVEEYFNTNSRRMVDLSKVFQLAMNLGTMKM